MGLRPAELALLSPGQFWDLVEGYNLRQEQQLRELAGLFLPVIASNCKNPRTVTVDKLVPPTVSRPIFTARGAMWIREESNAKEVSDKARELGFSEKVLKDFGLAS